MPRTIFANATVFLAQELIKGQVVVEHGKIIAIAHGTDVPMGAIDCEGDFLMPGLVELHTDNLERHLEPRPKVSWPHRAAIMAHDGELASAGITTVFGALRVGSVVSNAKVQYGEYARKTADEIMTLQAANLLRISHKLHLRAEICSETLPDELAKFGPADGVGIVSIMDHTPGERQFRDLTKLKEYVCGKNGLSDAEFNKHVTDQQALRAKVGHAHEAAILTAAANYGAVLASHDDTSAAQVTRSKSQGVRFAEFPTTTEAVQTCRDTGIWVMMGAPNILRGGSHSGNVAAMDLAHLGLLDILSSDYVPASLLAAALILGQAWGDLARGIATVTAAPARATGLDDRGSINIGLRADLIRVTQRGNDFALRETWVAGRRVG
ncbi:MAG: alpha-D-ribose 1-methylphosphonate 5-triphosphate diphosphatase [Paracoccaceae bacterium]|nr:alpha-D-ribose 1-methylphosphonate 5-triphosphate diphosphatase [Paracoccaceae bacterium]